MLVSIYDHLVYELITEIEWTNKNARNAIFEVENLIKLYNQPFNFNLIWDNLFCWNVNDTEVTKGKISRCLTYSLPIIVSATFLLISLFRKLELNPWSRRLSPVSVMISGWESLTPPGRDTNPSQVSSQQTLVFIYLPRKDGKPSWLRRKRRPHKDLNLGKVPGSNWGPRGWKAEILPTAPTTSGKPPLIINQWLV